MKIVICHAGISGYMTACWEALASIPGVDLSIIALPLSPILERNVQTNLDLTILRQKEWGCPNKMAEIVNKHNPDVVVIAGWMARGYRKLPFHTLMLKVPFFLSMDNPWRGDIRQRLGKFRIRNLVKRCSGVFVSNERGAQFARYLGFEEKSICSFNYGFDFEAFAPVLEKRAQELWPKNFVYLGRYAKEKGIGILVAGYQKYRRLVENPWPLACYGKGVCEHLLHNIAGVENKGFILPSDVPQVFLKSGVLVMPSLYEPWGVVLAEASAAGLPAICSSAVGSSLDLVRHLYNGYVVPKNDSDALATAMLWMHEHFEKFPEMGMRSQVYAEAYSAENWAARWLLVLAKALK